MHTYFVTHLLQEMWRVTEAKHLKKIAKSNAGMLKAESRRSMCEVNLDAALEDAEALVDELNRSRNLEQSLYVVCELRPPPR